MNDLSTQSTSNTLALPDVTPDEILLLRQIKRSVNEGYDIEVKRAQDGKMKALKVKKQKLAIV